jgi:hypothetical protein
MPYRPPQHQIAAKAVASVSGVWTSIGAAVEEVRQDYGEDLLVQPSLNGRMDAARIWVQVKGTQDAHGMYKTGGKSSIRVRADVALRWARTADILVLVLWDVGRNIGWYSIPGLTELHAELAEKDREEISLQVYSKDRFNTDSAKVIALEARLEHLGRLQEETRDSEPGDSSWANEAVAEAVIDMMIDLDMVKRTRENRRKFYINPKFRKVIVEDAARPRHAMACGQPGQVNRCAHSKLALESRLRRPVTSPRIPGAGWPGRGFAGQALG